MKLDCDSSSSSSSSSFFLSPVPSVYPRDVTLRLNETMLVVRWKPPPPDKINGILQGYDVIVKHRTRESKVRKYSECKYSE